MAIVNGGVGPDSSVDGKVAMGELAANYVGVFGELDERGGRDLDVVGNGRVVVTESMSPCQKCVPRVSDGRESCSYIMIGIGLPSATASNHAMIPSCVAAPAK